ncbi:hypothetical protein G9444_2675 [Rhodococcus erythropolis]|uniref:Uncharacterized protein n=1 Tax=Rhodococcus erythropolis TaxID=1833 RepID=A0A6G9CSX5_RHOER|nr:hypothetical protein G9444_2675 [Rhodococcus erythropolis]
MSRSHPSAGPTTVGDLEPRRDAAFVDRALPRREFFGVCRHVERQHFFLLAAQDGEDAVRGQFGERFRELEVVSKLRAIGFLALADRGDDLAAIPHQLTQFTDQIGVLGEALDEDRPGTVELLVRILRGIGGGISDESIGDGLVAGPRGRSAPWCAASA